jgi:hypothetical protein
MSALRRIHAMRREVGLACDDDWRDVLERTTGQRSAKGLTPVQCDALIAELGRLGAKGRSKGASKGKMRLSGPYAAKLQALWIACWNLGLIEDRTDAALNAFARRQTGLGHGNWVRDPDHLRAVVEALKAMCARGGVDWGPLHPLPGDEWREAPQARVAMAQYRLAGAHPEVVGRSFLRFAQEVTGQHPRALDRSGWIALTGRLGRIVRSLKSDA